MIAHRLTGPALLAAALLPLAPARAQVETASTATVAAGGLFSDEPLPAGGLFSADLDPTSMVDADGPPASAPRFTWALALGAQVAVDTSFDRRGENILEVSVAGRLELNAELRPEVWAHVRTAFDQTTALDREGGERASFDVPVPEAYVTLSLDRWRLRVGTLVHAWGSADLIRPLDVLNPVDFRRTPAVGQTSRIPVLGAEVAWSNSWLSVRGVVEPVFTASRFYLAGWDWAFAPLVGAQGIALPDLAGVVGRATADHIGDALLVIDRPSDGPENLTLGLRSTVTLGDLELSGSVVWGHEVLPRLVLDADLATVGTAVLNAVADQRPIDLFDPVVAEAFGRLQDKLEAERSLIEGTYLRRAVAGLDATYALDPFVLKLDAAYHGLRTLYSQTFAPVEVQALDVVVGLEYQRGEALQLLLEGFALTALDVPAGVRLAVLEARGAAPAEARAVISPGLALAGRWSPWDGDLSVELLVAATLGRGDLVLAPQVRWRPAEHHALRLAGLLVEGPPDGYGGAYTQNDQLVLGYEWTP